MHCIVKRIPTVHSVYILIESAAHVEISLNGGGLFLPLVVRVGRVDQET